MGDPKRFDLFGKVIAEEFNNSMRIADVAGGKGYLQAALRQKGFKQIETWDKRLATARKVHRNGYRFDYFNWKTAPRYDAVVAMHPDEGTDHCILYAGKHRVPAIICPCCIKPSASTYWGEHKYSIWLDHLINLCEQQNLSVSKIIMPMNGRNDVLVIKPA
jgi:hypothetical protein